MGSPPLDDITPCLAIVSEVHRDVHETYFTNNFLPEASFGLWVLSSPASVCLFRCVCMYQSLACRYDNSSAVQARITKFGSEVQNTLVKIPFIFHFFIFFFFFLGGGGGGSGDRPSPSRSNVTWKSNLTSFWVCPHNNLSPVSAGITKFGPEKHIMNLRLQFHFHHKTYFSYLFALFLNHI